MTNQSREIEKHPTLQIQLDISIIIRPLTMFFLKVHTLSLSHKSHCFFVFYLFNFLFLWRTDMEINGFWCIWIPEFHQIWFHVSSQLSVVLFSFSFFPVSLGILCTWIVISVYNYL